MSVGVVSLNFPARKPEKVRNNTLSLESLLKMSNRLAQYKKNRAVQSRKATVKEEKAVEVKSKRNERFMNRRALSEVTVQSQDEDTVKRKQPKRTIKSEYKCQ